MFKKRRIAKLITLIMAGVIVILPIVPAAFAVDPDETTVYYESESNDTYSTADRTYDDYDNYGKISSEDDVDWWYIVVTADGMANFWLGQIPTGCNYNMTLYKGNGTSAIVSSNNTGRTQELIRCHVYAGEVYRVKITSSSGYSDESYYKFRYKRSIIRDAEIFVTNAGDIDTTPTVTNAQPHLDNMGFTVVPRTNQLASLVYTELLTADIMVIRNHGIGGIMLLNDANNETFLYANTNSDMNSSDRAIDTYSASALSEVELVIFSGCKTGITSERYGNLVDAVIAKGAKCAIGWTESTYTSDSNRWVGKFFEYCSQGYNLHIARSLTNSWIRNNSPEDGDAIVSQYVGTSPMSNTILGLQY